MKTNSPPPSLPPPPPSNQGTIKSGSLTTNFTKMVCKSVALCVCVGFRFSFRFHSLAIQNKEKVEAKPSAHRAIYSSNDSGFSNELPPVAPEVDYSDDDDVPRKIPIR